MTHDDIHDFIILISCHHSVDFTGYNKSKRGSPYNGNLPRVEGNRGNLNYELGNIGEQGGNRFKEIHIFRENDGFSNLD